MKSLIIIFVLMAGGSIIFAQPKVELISNPTEKKVDVLVGGDLFTSYIYPDIIKKPVLWPVVSVQGNEITRQFPIKNKEGERVDHPHHVGIWLNYGDVNGLDFWNNSEAIPVANADKYGFIKHESVVKSEGGKGEGILITTASWNDSKGNKLLDEISEFDFSAKGTTRMIDRITKLSAVNGDVKFTDNKEGMFAIRVTRELELPENRPAELVDSFGNVTKVPASDGSMVTGNYHSSEGIEGGAVWGTRAKWMKLSGKINGEEVSVVIFDHPGNVGYPTYWHARGYGLFAANTLGQEILSNGENKLNFILHNNESVVFRYRLAVFSGNPSDDDLNKISKEFGNKL